VDTLAKLIPGGSSIEKAREAVARELQRLMEEDPELAEVLEVSRAPRGPCAALLGARGGGGGLR
jgi:hypothetical protein